MQNKHAESYAIFVFSEHFWIFVILNFSTHAIFPICGFSLCHRISFVSTI